jgi:hypothetical protein
MSCAIRKVGSGQPTVILVANIPTNAMCPLIQLLDDLQVTLRFGQISQADTNAFDGGILATAYRKRSSIRWFHFLQGYISSHWVAIQSTYYK